MDEQSRSVRKRLRIQKGQEHKQKVEVYIGYTDNTWETKVVKIPENTPSITVERTAKEEAMKLLFAISDRYDEVAFMGIYNYPYEGEEKEEE